MGQLDQDRRDRAQDSIASNQAWSNVRGLAAFAAAGVLAWWQGPKIVDTSSRLLDKLSPPSVEKIHDPDGPELELVHPDTQVVDPDVLAVRQFLSTRSAFARFNADERFNLLVQNQDVDVNTLEIGNPLRKQIDAALDAASSTFEYTPPVETTRSKLKAFQRSQALDDDGKFGPLTLEALATTLYGDAEQGLAHMASQQEYALLAGSISFNPDNRDVLDPTLQQLDSILNRIESTYREYRETHTGERLIAFQKAHGLWADSVLGSLTRFTMAQAIFDEPELTEQAAVRLGISRGGEGAFRAIVDHFIRREGGPHAFEALASDNPRVREKAYVCDNGGPTFCGITLTEYRENVNPTATVKELKLLGVDQVRDYYFEHYFERLHLAQVPCAIGYIIMDGLVNSGKGMQSQFCDELGIGFLSRIPDNCLPYFQRRVLELGNGSTIEARAEEGMEQVICELFDTRIRLYERCNESLRAVNMEGWLQRLTDMNDFLSGQGYYGSACAEQVKEAIAQAWQRI